jgi:GT2 family glycosyltransferase
MTLTPDQSDKPYSVLISILNWNTAAMTLRCVDSLLGLAHPLNSRVEIYLIDNGSRDEDFTLLKKGIDPARVTLHRESKNLGFAGGHNIGIDYAIEHEHDYIWLMNSDALVESATLDGLIAEMNANPTCGAVSPVIVATDDEFKMDYCGNVHDWANRTSIRAETVAEARKLQHERPNDTWVAGTAVLFRVAALAKVGGLDARLFAYYEDDDIAARLSAAGWVSRTAFDTRIRHAVFEKHFDRPPYFHYLTQRNYLAFWYKNTPPPYRRLLWLKLLDMSFYDVNRLYRRGFTKQADAAALGVMDFLTGKFGPPDLQRPVPLAMKLLVKIVSLLQYKALQKTPRALAPQT